MVLQTLLAPTLMFCTNVSVYQGLNVIRWIIRYKAYTETVHTITYCIFSFFMIFFRLVFGLVEAILYIVSKVGFVVV